MKSRSLGNDTCQPFVPTTYDIWSMIREAEPRLIKGRVIMLDPVFVQLVVAGSSI